MKKVIVLIIFMISIISVSMAEDTLKGAITGVIIDKETKKPLKIFFQGYIIHYKQIQYPLQVSIKETTRSVDQFIYEIPTSNG